MKFVFFFFLSENLQRTVFFFNLPTYSFFFGPENQFPYRWSGLLLGSVGATREWQEEGDVSITSGIWILLVSLMSLYVSLSLSHAVQSLLQSLFIVSCLINPSLISFRLKQNWFQLLSPSSSELGSLPQMLVSKFQAARYSFCLFPFVSCFTLNITKECDLLAVTNMILRYFAPSAVSWSITSSLYRSYKKCSENMVYLKTCLAEFVSL